MTTKRQLVLLFVVLPLMIPLIVTASFCLLKLKTVHASSALIAHVSRRPNMLNTQNGYSFLYRKDDIPKMAQQTIRFVAHQSINTHKVPIETWTPEKKAAAPMRQDSVPLFQKIVVVGEPLKESLVQEEASKEAQDGDPFLAEWRMQKKAPKTTQMSTQFSHLNKVSTQKKVFLSQRSPQKGSSDASSRDSGLPPQPQKPAPDDLMNEHYAALEGKVVGIDQHQGLFIEVSFLDRIGEDGLDSGLSTVLAAQEIRNSSGAFLLHLPAETQGYLIAKAYLSDDVQKSEPVLLGVYSQKPLRISASGLSDVTIELAPTEEYFTLHQNQFIGKVFNEYESDAKQCLTAVNVWVVETRQRLVTDQECLFEIRDLVQSKTVHLIFEKEGFITQELPITIHRKKMSRAFRMSPISKFVNGYDIFLGKRDPQKAVVFATLLKQGRPLSKAIVVTDEAEKIVYERAEGKFSLPDVGLYSTSANGRMVLWNANPGKRKLSVYQDGKLVVSQSVRLFAGVTHVLDIPVPE